MYYTVFSHFLTLCCVDEHSFPRPRSSLPWFEGPNHAHANSPENTEQHPFGSNRLTHKRQKRIFGVFEAAGEAIWSASNVYLMRLQSVQVVSKKLARPYRQTTKI